jgi:F-type H+-transporting ATPase subunit b
MLQSDTFWALVGLVLFLVILAYFGVHKTVLRALDARTARIKAELDEARKLREEAQALLADYQRRRRDAEAEAEAIVEEARREAERMTREATEKLRELVERRTKSAEEKIAQAEAQAIAEVRGRAAEIAVEAARRILEEKVQGEVADRILGDSIEAVRKHLN